MSFGEGSIFREGIGRGGSYDSELDARGSQVSVGVLVGEGVEAQVSGVLEVHIKAFAASWARARRWQACGSLAAAASLFLGELVPGHGQV
jgi:hypothetical protein